MKPNVPKGNQSLLIETSRQRVAEVLFNFPDKEFSLSDLAKEAGVAKAHIGAILNEFLAAEFIRVEKLSKIWRIRANMANGHFLKSKIIYNLNFVYRSGLVEVINQRYGHPKAIILFGSFRRGEDITSSDIDLAVETGEDIDPSATMLQQAVHGENKAIAQQLKEIEKKIKRRVQVFVFNRKSVDLNVFNNIANGIVLLGFLEVKK